MNPIQKNWINFKTHFCTAHSDLKETGELTMEAIGYHQYNLVNDIAAHMSRLPFNYPPQDPEFTPTMIQTTNIAYTTINRMRKSRTQLKPGTG